VQTLSKEYSRRFSSADFFDPPDIDYPFSAFAVFYLATTEVVIPAQAGIQNSKMCLKTLGPGLRRGNGNDKRYICNFLFT
jgi:hypothetical protein